MTDRLTAPRPRRRRLHQLVRTRLAIAGAVALAVSVCAVGVAGATTPTGTVAVDTPLATSITTTAGTWASVPMGHLDQPLNTFWQLFFLPAEGGTWKNHAGQLGVADNGGLLLAAPADDSLLVAIRPSHLLKYSAVVATASGSSWTPVPPLQGTAASLAAGAGGEEVALVQDTSGGRVLIATPGSSTWRRVVTAGALASSVAGRSCAPTQISTVGVSPSGAPLVGVTCGQSGVAGVFADENGTWESVGPKVQPSTARVAVLSLRTIGGEPTGLFSLTTKAGTQLVDGWEGADGSWSLSGGLSLPAHSKLLSVGAAPNAGEFVLYRPTSGGERLAVTGGPGTSWSSLPRPPDGTATVAFPSAGRVDALAVADTVMTDWVLASGASTWVEHQTTRVGILFGSST